MSTLPQAITHAGKRWLAVSAHNHEIDGLMYLLEAPGRASIYARVAECKPCRTLKRRMRDDKHVLECTGTAFTIRHRRSSKRYPFTLAEVYDMAAKRAQLGGSVALLRPRKLRRKS